MKIAVVGAGAMGSIYAALLSEAGHSVWAVDPNAAHVDAINRHGLRLTGPQGSRVYRRLRAVRQVEEIITGSEARSGAATPMDWIILATKAAHVPAAVQGLRPILGPRTLLLAMQNGLGAAERVFDNLQMAEGDQPRPHVALGVAQGFGAAMLEPGSVRFAAMKLMRFGEVVDGASPAMEAVASVWRDAGFDAQAFANLGQLIWEKFICNVALSGPCTVFEKSVGEMKASPEQWQIALNCGLEAFRVGQALGVPFSFDDAGDYISAFADSVADAKPSMLQDFEAGRRSEIDAINGRVPIEGDRVGVLTPWNTVVSEIVRAKEAEFLS